MTDRANALDEVPDVDRVLAAKVMVYLALGELSLDEARTVLRVGEEALLLTYVTRRGGGKGFSESDLLPHHGPLPLRAAVAPDASSRESEGRRVVRQIEQATAQSVEDDLDAFERRVDLEELDREASAALRLVEKRQ